MIIILAVMISTLSFAVIDEGFIGVKYQFGKIVDTNLNAGLNFKIPFVQTIKTVDVREQMYEMNTSAYTKDTQTVENLQVKLNYIYDKAAIGDIIRNIGIKNGHIDEERAKVYGELLRRLIIDMTGYDPKDIALAPDSAA